MQSKFHQGDDIFRRRVLLTGGAGYVGSVLARGLLARGFNVTVMDKLFFGNTFLDEPRIKVIQKDVRNIGMADLVGITDVIDLAAISNDPSGDLDKDLTFEVNFKARKNLQELCRLTGVGRYVLASTCSVYGFQDEIVSEASSLNPLTTYAETNAMAEEAALSQRNGDTIFTVIRQGTVYGASRRMRYDLVVNAMILNAVQGKPLMVLRNGKQWRPVVHVADTSDAMIQILTAPRKSVESQIFNVGSDDQNFTVLELASTISSALGKDLEVQWYGEPDFRSYRVSFSKIKKELGYSTEMTVARAVAEIKSGLEDTSLLPAARNYTMSSYQTLMAEGALR